MGDRKPKRLFWRSWAAEGAVVFTMLMFSTWQPSDPSREQNISSPWGTHKTRFSYLISWRWLLIKWTVGLCGPVQHWRLVQTGSGFVVVSVWEIPAFVFILMDQLGPWARPSEEFNSEVCGLSWVSLCGTLVAMVMRLPADAVTQLFFCLVLGLVLWKIRG